MRTSRRELTYYFLNTVHWIAIIVVAVLSIVAVIDTSDWATSTGGIRHAAKACLGFVQPYQKMVLAISGPTAIVTKIMANKVGPAWLWRAIERLLTEYRRECFNKGILDEAEFHHRVTLFQHVDWKTWWFWFTGRCWFQCWRVKRPAGIRGPYSGWLIVVRRSGYTTKRTNVTFLAPDDADFAEGVAGQAWAENRRILIQGLPDLNNSAQFSDRDNSAQLSDRELYAKQTQSTISWVNQRVDRGKHLPRSLLAMPVEVDNRIWGVIVVDSRSPEAIKSRSSNEFFAVVLGKLRGRYQVNLDVIEDRRQELFKDQIAS